MYTAELGENSPSKTHFYGQYIALDFQDGPIKEYGVNGTTNEEIISLLIDRLESLDALFPASYNSLAIGSLYLAKAALESRTEDRIARDVEGTNQA